MYWIYSSKLDCMCLALPNKGFTLSQGFGTQKCGMLQSQTETVSDFPPYFRRQQTSRKYKEYYEK